MPARSNQTLINESRTSSWKSSSVALFTKKKMNSEFGKDTFVAVGKIELIASKEKHALDYAGFAQPCVMKLYEVSQMKDALDHFNRLVNDESIEVAELYMKAIYNEKLPGCSTMSSTNFTIAQFNRQRYRNMVASGNSGGGNTHLLMRYASGCIVPQHMEQFYPTWARFAKEE